MSRSRITQFSRSDLTDILFQGVSSTSFMTLFSYCVANAQHKQFREPKLLAILARRIFPQLTEKESVIMGWLLHYMVGCMFTTAYNRLWKTTRLKRSWFTGLILGAGCGLIGILVWEAVFRIHPSPPRIDLKNYYRQLFIAHLIFGTVAAISNIHALQNRKALLKLLNHHEYEISCT